MLYIIGTGIYDEKDISVKGLEALAKCAKVYYESYTSPIDVNIENLEKKIGKKIELLDRKGVEESGKIIASAKKEDTAFLVGGDALSATTHIEFVLECKKKNIPCKIIHSSSIFTAIAETGLHLYKFGMTVSLPYPHGDYFPTSPYDNIEKNKKIGLHTLLLLDIGMTANQAIDQLLKLESIQKKGLFTEKTEIICLAHLGNPDGSQIRYAMIKEHKNHDYGRMPHTIIIPGNLHFTEEEFLETLR